jgi:hypothetical protein
MMELSTPRFENLTQDQVRRLYAYIRLSAREALAENQPSAQSIQCMKTTDANTLMSDALPILTHRDAEAGCRIFGQSARTL